MSSEVPDGGRSPEVTLALTTVEPVEVILDRLHGSSATPLLELEQGAQTRAIRGGHGDLPAGADLLGRLPVTDELTARRVVAQSRRAGVGELIDGSLDGGTGWALHLQGRKGGDDTR